MPRALERAAPLLLYLLLTIVMTWPLTAGLTSDVPGDLGDSLLNMWILGWGAEHFPKVLTGSLALADVWNANIFHPEPLALSFSEHLFGQVLQILPVYYATGNLILCYNLLFLSSFALSGYAMYLLVRDLTGDRYAAFVAGLIYAFVPFRIAQVAHIQTLSSQWMPFALYGFRRFITTTRIRALTGGTLALLMQNWSCGYYLIFFAPFVAFFVLHQIIAAGRTRELKIWVSFGFASAVVVAGTMPFLQLYLDGQRVHGFERPAAEIIGFSADVFGYLTAPEALRVLGSIVRAWPRPEGEVFLGVTAAILALIGVVTTLRHIEVDAKGRALAWVVGAIALLLSISIAAVIVTGGFVSSIRGVPIRANNLGKLALELAIALAALAVVSPNFRRRAIAFAKSTSGLALFSFLLAVWLSFGPVVHSRGEVIADFGLYGMLLDYVPGFGGLRVPARYAMVAALYLAVLAGIGATWLLRPRLGRVSARPLAIALSAAVVIETAFLPMPVNQTWGDGPNVPPARVEPGASAPDLYHHLAGLPDDVVLAEFPFGDPAWELRYVYYSTVHWKRILNGYSGGFPQGYMVRAARLARVSQQPDEAWKTLVDAGTTHVAVHGGAMTRAESVALERWLRAHNATEAVRFDDDVLYALPYAR